MITLWWLITDLTQNLTHKVKPDAKTSFRNFFGPFRHQLQTEKNLSSTLELLLCFHQATSIQQHVFNLIFWLLQAVAVSHVTEKFRSFYTHSKKMYSLNTNHHISQQKSIHIRALLSNSQTLWHRGIMLCAIFALHPN